jgi:hypothetical protein
VARASQAASSSVAGTRLGPTCSRPAQLAVLERAPQGDWAQRGQGAVVEDAAGDEDVPDRVAVQRRQGQGLVPAADGPHLEPGTVAPPAEPGRRRRSRTGAPQLRTTSGTPGARRTSGTPRPAAWPRASGRRRSRPRARCGSPGRGGRSGPCPCPRPRRRRPRGPPGAVDDAAHDRDPHRGVDLGHALLDGVGQGEHVDLGPPQDGQATRSSFLGRRPRAPRMALPALTSSIGGAVSDTRMVSPMPWASRAPMPTRT